MQRIHCKLRLRCRNTSRRRRWIFLTLVILRQQIDVDTLFVIFLKCNAHYTIHIVNRLSFILMHVSSNKTRYPYNCPTSLRERTISREIRGDNGSGEDEEGTRVEKSRSRFVIHIRVSEDKAIKSPRASGCGADSPGLPRRIKLTDPPGTQRDEQTRRDRRRGEERGSCRIKWKENIVFFMRRRGREIVRETGSGKTRARERSRWTVRKAKGRWKIRS